MTIEFHFGSLWDLIPGMRASFTPEEQDEFNNASLIA